MSAESTAESTWRKRRASSTGVFVEGGERSLALKRKLVYPYIRIDGFNRKRHPALAMARAFGRADKSSAFAFLGPSRIERGGVTIGPRFAAVDGEPPFEAAAFG